MKKRILSMILALSMVLSILPVSAFADAGAASAANSDGETVYEENSVQFSVYVTSIYGTDTDYKEFKYAAGDSVAITAPKREGYTFQNWVISYGLPANTDVTQETIHFTMPAGMVILRVETKLDVSEEEYLLVVEGDNYKEEQHKKDDLIEITAPDPNKEGKTFDHWEVSGLPSSVVTNNKTISFNMPANTVILTPKYKEPSAQKYFVYVDGGETEEHAAGEKVSIPAPEPKKGYAFSHWEADCELADAVLTQEPITFTMPANNVTLIPKYKMSQYTLTVKDKDGKDGRVEKHAMGELISVSAPYPEDGYTFTGWKVDGQLPDGTGTNSAYISFRMPANNVTLTPQYAKKYSVSRNGVKQGSYFEGDTVTVEAPEVPGYTFTGWETDSLPEGAVIDGKTVTFKMPAYDVTVKANMEQIVTKTLKITKAKVTLQDGSEVADLNAVPVGTKLVATADADTDTSEFKRWSCTGMMLTEGQSKARVLEFEMPDQNVELTAMFGAPATPDPEPTPDPDPAPAPSDDGSAAVIMAATVVGGAAVGVGAYMVGTTVYLKSVLPEGVAIPANRQQLAVALWTAAGKPATQSTALFNDVAADAAELQAIRWAVDTGLMTAQDGNFKPGNRVSRWEVIRTWKSYQKRG